MVPVDPNDRSKALITLWHPLRGPAGRIFGALSLLALAACGGGDDSASAATSTRAAAKSGAAASTTTAGALDPLAALTVTSSVPGDGGNNQPRTRQPSFTFSSLLNAASVNGGNFSLRAGEATVPAAIRVIDRVARLEPAAKLLPQTQFTVRAMPGILDTFGQTLAEPVQRSFVTVDATWKEPGTLPFAFGDTGTRPLVAVDARGNALVVWNVGPLDSQDAPGLMAHVYDAARNTWSLPTVLMPPGGHHSPIIRDPQLAMDAAGNAVLAFQYQLAGENTIWASRYNAAQRAWETPQLVSSNDSFAEQSTAPRLVVRPDGEAIIAWHEWIDGPTRSTVSIATSRNSTTSGLWSVPRRSVRLSPQYVWYRNLALAAAPQADGPVVLVWSDPPTTPGAEIWAAVGTSDGSFGPPQQISTAGGNPEADPQVVVDSAGHAQVVWQRQGVPGSTEPQPSLWHARFDGTLWQAPRRIGPEGERSEGASLATRLQPGQPGPAITWVSWLANGNRVKAARLLNDAAPAPQLIGLSPTPFAAGQRSTTGIDPAGNVLVLWSTGPGATPSVMAARQVSRLGAWQSVRTLDSAVLAAPYTPSLAINASGDALALWQHERIDANGRLDKPIVMRRFD